MNVAPTPFPLRLADPRQLPQDAGPVRWIPAVKGYSSLSPDTFAPDPARGAGGGPSRAITAAPTHGLPTQFGKFTDPPREDWPSLEMLG